MRGTESNQAYIQRFLQDCLLPRGRAEIQYLSVGNCRSIVPHKETCRGDGAEFACESVICNEALNADAQADCAALGKALV